MSGYLHFSNNLKDLKDHLGFDKFQNLFPIHGNGFFKKTEHVATPYITSGNSPQTPDISNTEMKITDSLKL